MNKPNLILSWTEWNSGGGCMIWSHDFTVDDSSVHVTDECLVLSSLTSEKHWEAEHEDPDFKHHVLVVDFPRDDLAFRLTPYIGQETANVTAKDVDTILKYINRDEDNYMVAFKHADRNALGRLVTHAESAKHPGSEVTSEKMIEAMFPGDLDKQISYLTERLEQLGGPQLTPAYFGFDEGPVWPGFHDGQTWNGWAKPYFTKETCDEVIAYFNEDTGDGPKSYYDEAGDFFVLGCDLAAGPTEVYHYTRETVGGMQLFQLGSGLVWDVIDGEELVSRLGDGSWFESDAQAMRTDIVEAGKLLHSALDKSIALGDEATQALLEKAIDEVNTIIGQ